MGSTRLLAIVALAALLLAEATGSAADAAQRWALLIGAGRYTDPSLPPVRSSANDVRRLAVTLRAGGYEVLCIADGLGDDCVQPTRNNILVQTEMALSAPRLAGADVVLVYFTGHARVADGAVYLLPTDGYQARTEATGLRLAWLCELIRKCRAAHKLLLLDACHHTSPGAAEQIRRESERHGFISWVSCRGEEVSLHLADGNKEHTAFAHYLVAGLRGDADRDGQITLSELARHVREKVGAFAAAQQKVQTPALRPVGGDPRVTVIGRLSMSVFEEDVRLGAAPPPLTWINPRDGQEMILVPEGEFTMGADDLGEASRPMHRNRISACYIGKTEVTVAQFMRFVRETGYRPGGRWQTQALDERWPVVGVAWDDAVAYCRWALVRLPTEAEWEKAARGADGRVYPWGSIWDPDFCRSARVDPFSSSPVRRLVPVASTPKDTSPWGCCDMAGNAQEWTSSLIAPYPYRAWDGRESLDRTQMDRVARGGHYWADLDKPGEFAAATRKWVSKERAIVDTAIGFRCARSAR